MQPFFLATFLLISCQDDEVQTSLNQLLQEELSFMVAELQSGAGLEKVREKPFYVIREFKKLPSDSSFTNDLWIRVEFYYLKGSTLCQERTYSHPRMGQGFDRLSKKMIQCDTLNIH